MVLQQHQHHPPHHHHHHHNDEDSTGDWVLTEGRADRSSSEGSSPDRSRTFTPSSPTSNNSTNMGKKRMSFTRMDHIPQVRIDLKHLSYVVKNQAKTTTTTSSSSSSTNKQKPWSSLLTSTTKRRKGDATTTSTNTNTNTSTTHTTTESETAALLDDISVSFTPGTLSGLMGPSGSGKTSLLRVLHGAPKYTRHVQGQVLVNGTPVKNISHAFRKMCSLVPQEDVLLPNFTVYETLMFAAQLRLPQTDTAAERQETVDAVMLELGLDECKDVRVGSVEKVGISGGQRRRVSIGLELLTDPSVLLLDEPTSGLDSKTAEDICSLLQQLAGPDRCVCASIHQPSYQIFISCFDRFVFLVGGCIAWDGPPSHLASFFHSLGYEAPSYENPADFYLRVLQEEPGVVLEGWREKAAKRDQQDMETAMASTPGLIVNGSSSSFASLSAAAAAGLPRPLPSSSSFVSLASHSNNNKSTSLPNSTHTQAHTHTHTHPLHHNSSRYTSSESLIVPGGEVLFIDHDASWLKKDTATAEALAQTHTSFSWQFSVLLKRMLMDNLKDRRRFLVGFAMEVFTGIVVGLVWYKQPVYTQRSIFPVMGVFCMATTITVFDAFLSFILTFPLTRSLHFREYNNGYYTLLPYFCAILCSSSIISALYQLTDVMVIFFMVGLPFTLTKFFTYMCLCAIGACIGSSLGFLIGCFTSDIRRMQQVVVPTLLPLLIFSGYMIPLERMPKYLTWIYYGSFYQRLYSSLVINHFEGLVFVDCPGGGQQQCRQRGEEVLKTMSLADPQQLMWNVGILLGTLGVLLVCGYAALRYKSLR